MPLDAYCGVSSDPKVSEVPHLAPLFHVGALYAVARGGFTPYVFGGSAAIHAFRYRPDAQLKNGIPPSPSALSYLALGSREARSDPAKQEYLLARFAEYGAVHDHLLVVGANEAQLAGILARGFAPDWQGSSAMLAHPRPCPIDVVVEGDDPRDVHVEIGQRPAGEPVFSMAASRGEVLADGARRMRFAAGGCGPWVRGYRDVDGSGTASRGDVFCAGAGRDGNLAIALVTPAEVRCRIEGRGLPEKP